MQILSFEAVPYGLENHFYQISNCVMGATPMLGLNLTQKPQRQVSLRQVPYNTVLGQAFQIGKISGVNS